MKYIGLDVHKSQSTICILDKNGKKIRTQTIRGSWQRVLEEIKKIHAPFSVCFEASIGYGYLYENLRKMARHVAVAHPGHLRLIFRSKKKNDRVDAEKLAKLLFLDEVPNVYVPKDEVRAWRGMIEHRHRLVGERTRSKNALRALCRGYGLTCPKGLWSKKGLVWLRTIEWSNEMSSLQRDILVERVESLTAMIGRVEIVLKRRAETNIGVRLLMTIPGVGIRTAEAMVAYIDNADRFNCNKSVGGYLGLVPRQDASGSVNRLGHITKDEPGTVRKLLVEAAWQGIRRSERIRGYFKRIQQGDSQRRKIALVATAHYLARVMLAMLKTGECWRDEERVAA